MLYANFILAAMLAWASFLALYFQQTYALKGGPHYYIAGLPDGENPIQPKFKIPYAKVKQCREVWEVHNDSLGLPVMIKSLRYGRERGRKFLYRGRGGRLRYEGYPGPGGIELQKMSEP